MMVHAKIINALKIQTCTSPTNQAITFVRFRVQMKYSLLELESSNKNLHCSYAVWLHLQLYQSRHITGALNYVTRGIQASNWY